MDEQFWDRNKLITQFGYNHSISIENFNELINIWNIIGASYKIDYPYLILSDNILNKLKEYFLIHTKLNNKWYKYSLKKNCFNKIISWTDYEILVEKRKKEAEEQKKKEEELKKKTEMKLSEDLKTLASLKNKYQSTWIDSNWINTTIGTYDNPFAEYYWTLITKNNYQITDWKGNIRIREDVYKLIETDETFQTYSGKNFLSRSFKNKQGYRAYIDGTYPYLAYDGSGWGIYGIYYTEKNKSSELIYIGMTCRGFQTRWKEHYNIFAGVDKPSDGMILYQQNLDVCKITFKKIIDITELKYEGTITRRDVEAMELALISLYKPKYNTVGIAKSYIFN